MRRHPFSEKHTNAAFTLLELLVAISVIALLLAMALPAVARAWEAANRAQCQLNLRQLTMAAHGYYSAHQSLPAEIQQVSRRDLLSSYLSVHGFLLPYLDQQTLYEQINTTKAMTLPSIASAEEWAEVSTIVNTRVKAFLCPSQDSRREWPNANSYRACWGLGPSWNRSAEFPDSGMGIFNHSSPKYPNRLETVTDGLGKTAMFSERILGRAGSGFVSENVLSLTWPHNNGNPRDADFILRICAGRTLAKESASIYFNAGKYWLFTGLHQTLYNHAILPNSLVYDCMPVGFLPPPGASTARSYHPGGVNVAFGDGSVHFLHDGIDRHIWYAIATRNGGESVADGEF